MILNSTDNAWVVWPVTNGRFEDYTLVVTLALTFGFDAIGAGRSLLTTLYAAFSTGETSSLGPLPHLGVGCRTRDACW